MPQALTSPEGIPLATVLRLRGDYTKVTYLHGKGERIANVTRQVGS